MTDTGEVAPAFDAVVLAGGTARRLGGASKPDVEVGGRRLLDHALEATAGAREVVVVGPDSVSLPAGVLRTLEDPPFGGPVAGLAAGLAALDAADGAPAPLVLVLACDIPGAARAVPRLLRAAAATANGQGETAGAYLVDAEGHPQWLLAVYVRTALSARLAELESEHGVRDVGVRALVSGLPLARVDGTSEEAADVDTWADAAALTSRAATSGMPDRAYPDIPGGGTR